MEEKRDQIQLKSEEFQEILEDIPNWILRWGITIIALFLIAILIGSSFFAYPDIVQSSMTLTSMNQPVEIMTKETGRIREIYVSNESEVREGDYLVSFESSANPQDILLVKAYLTELKEHSTISEPLSRELSLGDIYNEYVSFYHSFTAYKRNSTESNQQKLELATSSLQNQLSIWENQFVLKSPTAGKVIYSDLWQLNQTIQSGSLVFTIIPNEPGELIGKAYIPTRYLGKVETGQQANIYFDAFPSNEFGIVKGTIQSISPIIQDDHYLVEIKLFQGLFTSYKKTLPYHFGMKGRVDIVTEDLSLLDRFLYVIKKL